MVDTIKNIHEKQKPDYVPEFKSRLVSCGNFEDAEGARTDAPTSDIETHAYFQAMPIDRIVIMRQPQGGLPGVDPEAFLLIRIPVYGLCDSGRGFWKKVDQRQRGRTVEQSYLSRVLLPYRERRCGCCSHHARR